MPEIDLKNIPDAPKINFDGIPDANNKPGILSKENLERTAKETIDHAKNIVIDIGLGYPMAETAANLISNTYGVPLEGLTGLLSSPANYIWKDANEKAMKTVHKLLVYEPQTKRGKARTEKVTLPFKALDQIGSIASDKVYEKTNSPVLATAIKTAIVGAPALIGLKLPGRIMGKVRGTTAWRQLTIKERGLIVQGLEDTIRRNPAMSEGEILRRWDNLQKEAYAKRNQRSPETDLNKIEKEIETEKPEPTINELEADFNKYKEIFFQERDEKLFRANVESRLLQKELKASLEHKRYSKVVKDIDQAIQIHIDTKQNPGHIEEYYDKLTDRQKEIVDLSQNLPEEIKPIVDKIDAAYKEIGIEALDAEVIHNTLDNYVGRTWDLKGKSPSEIYRKFGTTTRHAKQRVFDTIIEGWAKGYELKIEGAINNLRIIREEITKTIENRKFLKNLQKVKDPDGNKLISDKQLEGYKRIEHPNFKSWKWAGKIDIQTITYKIEQLIRYPKEEIIKIIEHGEEETKSPIARLTNVIKDALTYRGMTEGEALNAISAITKKRKVDIKSVEKIIKEKSALVQQEKILSQKIKPSVYSRNIFVDDAGNVFERRELYAPKAQANNLNNIFGSSYLNKIPLIPTITKYNAISKSWILQTSLFHHLAFLRSFYLPGISPRKWNEISPRLAFKDGIESIERLDPIIIQGVRNGLTLGLKQDWSESFVREKTVYGKVLDEIPVANKIKNAIIKAREMQADWLFGELGASLKAKAFAIEYRNQLKKYPEQDPDVIARDVATLINDDFGGLHLQRMGRNPTLQHILRLILLAPDWTESNVRTMIKQFPTGKDGSRFYTSKAAAKMYRKFWLGVLVKGMAATALLNYLLAGGDSDKFLKNYKKAWKAGNLKSLGVDITPIYKALGGKSGNDKYFYLIGHFRDPIKFLSHPVKSLHHKGSVLYGFFHEAVAGTDWAGREFTSFDELLHEGKTVEWRYGGGGPIEWDQMPSYLINEFVGTQPIQIQNFMQWLAGEQEAFDTISNSLGLGIVTEYKSKSKIRR